MADPDKAPAFWKRMLRILVWLAQGVVAMVLLGRLFTDVQLRQGVGKLLGEGNWGWALGGIACVGVSILANVARWRIFLSIQGVRVRWRRLGPVYLIGSFFNLFLPGVVGGEAVSALYLMRDHPRKKGRILLSIMADHFSGLLALVVAAAVFASARADQFLSEPLSAAAFRFMWAGIGGALFVVAISILLTHPGVRERLPGIPGREHILRVAACFQLFIDFWKRTLQACAISFVVLFSYFAAFYCSGRAFNSPLSLLDVFSVMPVVDVVTMVPVSISGLGVREIFMRELLGVLAGIPADQAVLLSLMGFGFTVAWGMAGGVLFLFVRTERPPEVAGEPGPMPDQPPVEFLVAGPD